MDITMTNALLWMALLCFIFGAVGFRTRLNLTALGLACWLLSVLLR